MTKNEILTELNKYAAFHLGFPINFQSYTRLNKAELLERLVNAEKMHEQDIIAKIARSQRDDRWWQWAYLTNGNAFSAEDAVIFETYNSATRKATEFWHKV